MKNILHEQKLNDFFAALLFLQWKLQIPKFGLLLYINDRVRNKLTNFVKITEKMYTFLQTNSKIALAIMKITSFSPN